MGSFFREKRLDVGRFPVCIDEVLQRDIFEQGLYRLTEKRPEIPGCATMCERAADVPVFIGTGHDSHTSFEYEEYFRQVDGLRRSGKFVSPPGSPNAGADTRTPQA
jgi:hypothetical protein